MIKRINIPKIPENNDRVVVYDGIKQYAIFNIEGEIFAINQRCPHQGAPLIKGRIFKSKKGPMIECPRHGWQFCLQDGACLKHPLYTLSVFEVEICEESAYIIVPESF